MGDENGNRFLRREQFLKIKKKKHKQKLFGEKKEWHTGNYKQLVYMRPQLNSRERAKMKWKRQSWGSS